MEILYTILRIAGIIGIVVFGFSVSISLESIAKSLKQIAGRDEEPGASSQKPS
jgi:hypothetical protein